MGDTLTTGSTICMDSAGVVAADSAGLSAIKSYSALLTAIAGAPLASPTFTGTPAAPTASPGTNTTQIATTAFVTAAVAAAPSGAVTAINNAAVNRLTTIGSTTTELDAEATLTYDGTQITQLDGSGNELYRIRSTNPFNVFIGYGAGKTNTIAADVVGGLAGTANTSVGHGTLEFLNNTGRYNAAFGTHAGNAITEGELNTFIGANSGLVLTTGDYNTACGVDSMRLTYTGVSNAAFGVNALYNCDASYNAAFGSDALRRLTSGVYDVAVGYNCLSYITTGNNNMGLGLGCGVAVATGTVNLTTGGSNVFIGTHACGNSASLANHAIIGSELSPFYDVFFGKGQIHATPVAYRINGTGGQGTNVAGADVVIAGGKGTGTGASGRVLLQAAPVGSSGTALNALADSAAVDASTTATHTRFLVWDVDTGALQRVTVGAADSGGTGFKVLRIPN